jgi:hypothetical protein
VPIERAEVAQRASIISRKPFWDSIVSGSVDVGS